MQRISASYYSVSTIGQHTLACSMHESVFFTAGEHWSKVLRSLFAAQHSDFICLWISSSSCEAFSHTPSYFTCSKNCTGAPFRTLEIRDKEQRR